MAPTYDQVVHYLRHLSSGCYEALRQSGCVSLYHHRGPSETVHTHFAKATTGFLVDVDLQLIEAAEFQIVQNGKNVS